MSTKTILIENHIILEKFLLLNGSVKINKESVGQGYYT